MNSFYQSSSQVIAQSPAEHLKNYLQKKVILTIGIISIIQLLFSSVLTVFTNYLSTSAASQSSVIQYILLALTIIPSLIYSLSYIIIYIQAKKGKNPMGAVTALQVLSVIALVVSSLALFLFTLCFILIFMGIGIFSTGYSHISGDVAYNISMTLLLVVFCILELLLLAFLFYYIALVRLAFSAKGILTGRSDKVKGATAVGVYNIIFCIFACFATLIMLIGFIATLIGNEGFITISVNNRAVTGANAILIAGLMLIMLIVGVVTFIIKAKAAFGLKRHMNAFSAFGNMSHNNPNQFGSFQQSPNQYGDQYNNPGYQQNGGYPGNPYDNNPYSGNQG